MQNSIDAKHTCKKTHLFFVIWVWIPHDTILPFLLCIDMIYVNQWVFRQGLNKGSFLVCNNGIYMIKKANLSIIILAISLSFHLAVLLFFLKGGDIYALSYDVSFQFFFFLFWSAVLVIFMFLIQTATFFRLFILLRSILFVAITFTFPNDLSLEFFLVTALILEINIYESFPYNLVFSIGCIVLGIYAK